MTNPKINVLMTGAGAPGGPGIIKCLQLDQNINLIVGDINPKASGGLLHNKFVNLPSASDKNFTEKIIDICKLNKIDIIFPLVTRELFNFAKDQDRFNENNIKVIVSPIDSLKIANDKVALYQHLNDLGIETPNFFVVNNLDEIKKSAINLGYPTNSVVIKIGISNGSRGIRILDDSKDRLDSFLNEKPNNMFTTLEEISKVIGDNTIPRAMICENLPGDEVTIDTVVKNGKMQLCLIRMRDRISGGISTAGHFIEDKFLENYCSSVINSLELDGPIGFQLKKDINGKFKILEINPRIQGTSVSAMSLGINLPLIAIYNSLNMKYKLPNKLHGKGFVRYFEEIYFDV